MQQNYNISFTIGLLVGIYTQTLFIIGILGYLYKPVVIWVTIPFILLLIWKIKNSLNLSVLYHFFSKFNKKNKLFIFLITIFCIQVVVNLIGTLAPELAYDALWYHLTLPKLYLEQHKLFFIPGGLMYYSAMPKLGEVFYIGALSIGGDTMAKLSHFTFGLLTCFAIYGATRMFLPKLIAVIAVIIFYSNLVVAWESTTAYIDLIRAFFEVLSLWAFMTWWKLNNNRWLFLSAIMLGFAISSKVLATGSLILFCILIILKFFRAKKINFSLIKTLIIYIFLSLIVPLPWFIFSYITTGNPVYPFFSSIYAISPEPFLLHQIVNDIMEIFLFAPDPVSPLYLIFSPLILISFLKLKTEIKIVSVYVLFAIIIWYFTPRTGGGRFILPYLPALSILCAGVLYEINKRGMKFVYKFCLYTIIFISLVTITYRMAASIKYLPVLMGQETKHEFLSNHLNFAFGDFYDTDNYFSHNLKANDVVLLYGFHNLYYVEFRFIDSSWVKSGDRFNYVALQKIDLPQRFKHWQLIHENAKTMVKVYKPPKGVCQELCVY